MVYEEQNCNKMAYQKDIYSTFNPIIQREAWWKLAIIIGLVSLCFIILIAIDNMLSSFILAAVISYLSEPFIGYFERKGIQRVWCISLYFTFAIVLLTVLTARLLPLITRQAVLLQSELPEYVESITRFLAVLESKVSGSLPSMYEFQFSSNIGNLFQRWIELIIGSVPVIAQNTVITLLLAPFFAFFLLKDGQVIRRKFLALVPNFLFEMVLNLTYNINLHIGGFIRARLLEALIVGVVVWIGLTIIQFPYTAFLALFAGTTNLIPYIGPIIGMIPAYIIAFAGQNVEVTIILITLVYSIAQFIDMFFIIPLVVARIVDLHPITVIVVIIIGSQVMGIIGMIISIPVTKCIKLTVSTIYAHFVEFRTDQGLME